MRTMTKSSRFKIKKIRVYRPQPRQIPAPWLRHRGQFKNIVYVYDKAIEAIKNHAAEDTRRECFGLLLGNAFIDTHRGILWILLQHSVAARNTTSGPGSVEVSKEEFRRINDEVDRIREMTNGQTRKIGWYHSHPNYGVFMSKTDRANQSRYYSQNWQLALVVDPVRDTMGFFRGAASTPCAHRIVSAPAMGWKAFYESLEPTYDEYTPAVGVGRDTEGFLKRFVRSIVKLLGLALP